MQFSRERDSLRTADIAHCRNNTRYTGYLALNGIVDQCGVRSRIRSHHDALAGVRDRLPDFLGDEWHEWMRESQEWLETFQKALARAGCRRGTFVGQNRFGEFEIPVAVLVPDEMIECVRGFVEPVGFQRGSHFPCAVMQTAEDPPVRDRP